MSPEVMFTTIQLLSGIFWTYAYFRIWRVGLVDKTYGMPILALALNMSWELIYFSGGVLRWDEFGSIVHAQTVVNFVWLILDILILQTLLHFNLKNEFTKRRSRTTFLLFGLVFGVLFYQVIFLFALPPETAAYYSAFLQNLIMSILFIHFIIKRPSGAGQRINIAMTKLFGTLLATIGVGIILGYFPILLLGTLILIADIVYMYKVYAAKQKTAVSAV